jgi:thiol-disulfide isomerase/thioredoxin
MFYKKINIVRKELCYLIIEEDYYQYSFFIDSDTIEIVLDNEDHHLHIKGGIENDFVFSQSKAMTVFFDKLKGYKDSLNHAKEKRKIEKYLNYEKLSDQTEQEYLNYLKRVITSNPDRMYSCMQIYQFINRGKYLDTGFLLLKQLSAPVLSTNYAKRVEAYIEQRLKSRISQLNLKQLKLIDRRKVEQNATTIFAGNTVIDLWASWCSPCLEEIPILKKLYSLKRTNAIKIVSISIDTDFNKWKISNNKQDLFWTSVLDGSEYFRKQFRISSIPRKLLVSKSGKIIKDFLSFNEIAEILKGK